MTPSCSFCKVAKKLIPKSDPPSCERCRDMNQARLTRKAGKNTSK